MLPSEAIQGAAQAKAAQNRNAMFEMDVADRQAAAESDAKLNALFQQSGGDMSKMREGATDYRTASMLDKQISEQSKMQGQADKARLQAGLEKLNYGSQLLQGATPENWQQIRQEFGQMTGQDLGEQFDPAKVGALMQQGLAMKDRLANEWKQKGYELDVAKFGEQQRHNSASEGISYMNAQTRAEGGGDLKPQYDSNRGGYFDPNTKQFVALTGEGGAPLPSKNAAPKPLPPAALKMQQEALDAIGTAGTINADLASVEGLIDTGKLDFGPVSNLKNKALNAAGASTEQSRNFATFQSTLEKLRNDSLRLNKGVQTDGDAQRAWNELLQNINDPEVVKQRLAEIQKINERGAALQQMNVDQIRANYGADPLDASGRLNQPSAIGAQNSADDFTSLWN